MHASIYIRLPVDLERITDRQIRERHAMCGKCGKCRKRKKGLDLGSNSGLPQFMKGALTTELPSQFVEESSTPTVRTARNK